MRLVKIVDKVDGIRICRMPTYDRVNHLVLEIIILIVTTGFLAVVTNPKGKLVFDKRPTYIGCRIPFRL